MSRIMPHLWSKDHENALVIMPISRVWVEEVPIHFERIDFYPENYLPLRDLRIIPNRLNDLREMQTLSTGVSEKVFLDNTTIAFASYLNWEVFYRQDHNSDCQLISELSQYAEKFMDVVRLFYCRLDLPDTLPGRVGTWNDGSGFSTALLFDPENHESYIIAGRVVTHINVIGVGLELYINNNSMKQVDNGETGRVVQTALSLRTAALEANNPSLKYFQSISLFEFLAYPTEYQSFDKVKRVICRHLAHSKHDYLRLLDRFDILGNKGDGTNKGYRDRIVHRGERIEDIMGSDKALAKLFYELDCYFVTVIGSMLEYADRPWSDFADYRNTLKIKLGLT